MAQRPLGLAAGRSPIPQADYSGLADTVAYFQQRVNDATARKFEAVAEVGQAQRLARPARAPREAQVAFDGQTGKYIVAGQEFDANDYSAIDAIAQLQDAPLQQLAPGQEAYSLADIQRRRDSIRNNAEVDNSFESRARGSIEAIAGIPRGIGQMFGADVGNPLQGSAEEWRRSGGLSLREQAGRTMRPTESLVGLGNAFFQAAETGLPVLAAGAVGSLASPLAGIAAGVSVAGGMAADSQSQEAGRRLAQTFAEMSPEQFVQNPEYMALRRAGNSHPDTVAELVRRGQTSAARSGAAIGGVSGLVAGGVGRYALRGTGMLGGTSLRAGDEVADALNRALRGVTADGAARTGIGAASRSVAGLGAIGAVGEGTQEFFESDISQAMADSGAGIGSGYQFGRYGSVDDFVGGAVGGGPLAGFGGLRTPPPRLRSRSGDPGLDAALDGVVAPPGGAAPQGPAGPRQISAADALAFDRKNFRDQNEPSAVGQTADMFGANPSFGPGVDAEAAAATEVDELSRVIPLMQQRMQASTNPDEQAWIGMQLESLEARREQLESQFGLGRGGAPADPRQMSMFDSAGNAPVQQGGVGETADMFGRAPSVGPSGEMDSTDVADPTGDALGRSRDLMAARYGTQPLFDQNGLPGAAAMDPNFAGFEGMVDTDVAGGPGVTNDAPAGLGSRGRREAQQERQARRYEESYNNPAALPDEFSGVAAGQTELAQERDQLQRMLDERRAAGFVQNDPVATGIEQRLAQIDEAIGPRGTQAELTFPNTGQQPRPASPTAVEPEVEPDLAPTLGPRDDDQTQPMFGPQGGPTTAARVPKNETLRESDRKISAEIAEMLDPNAGRDAVWSAGRSSPPAGVKLPKNVRVVKTPRGILLTTNAAKARRLQGNPALADKEAEIGKLLNFPISKGQIVKSGETPVVVEGRDKATGTPTTQMLVPESKVAEGVAAVTANVNPEKTAVTTTTPEASVQERAGMTAAEAKRGGRAKADTAPARQPTPDQRAGEVKVELSGTPEQQRQTLLEMLAPLQRKIDSKATGKTERERAQAEANRLLAQLDALDAAPTTTETAGRGPAKGSVQEGATETGRDRTGPAEEGARRSPTEEAKRVDREAAELARQIRELEAEPPIDFGSTDESISPTAQPFAGVEITNEEGLAPEQQRKLSRTRQRLENLNQLLACVLK